MYIHNLEPVVFTLGPLVIRWYSLAYIFGIIFAFKYVLFLEQKYQLKLTDKKRLEDLTFTIILGIILGGRIGYTLFYNFAYYSVNPIEIFFIWQGGMSFHGGLIGFTLAVLFYAKKHQQDFLRYMDVLACSVPLGLFLGRIANFINGELYGRVTDVAWAVIFPLADNLPRHPSQLYEALLEGVLTFIILYYAFAQKAWRDKPGSCAGLFLMCYALSRIFVEFFREPDEQIGFIFSIISMGQLLSLPMLMLGIYLIKFYHGQSSRK